MTGGSKSEKWRTPNANQRNCLQKSAMMAGRIWSKKLRKKRQRWAYMMKASWLERTTKEIYSHLELSTLILKRKNQRSDSSRKSQVMKKKSQWMYWMPLSPSKPWSEDSSPAADARGSLKMHRRTFQTNSEIITKKRYQSWSLTFSLKWRMVSSLSPNLKALTMEL